MKEYKIYGLKLKNDDLIRYIGYTGNTLKHRLNGHISKCNINNNKNSCWIRKHKDIEGIEIVLLIDNIFEIELAWEKERELIKEYRDNGFNLTNTSDGGEGSNGYLISEKMKGTGNHFFGKKHTEVAKRKMSEKKKLYIGDKNPFFGKKHTEETKKTISISNKGKYVGDKNPFFLEKT